MTTHNPIRVFSVDDSAFFRKVLADILGHRPDIDFVGCASDPYKARDRLRSLTIDVLTLELGLPRMPGLTFLKLIMERKPMPVIVVSSSAPTGSKKAVEALIAGAVAVIEKPRGVSDKASFEEKLIAGITGAADAALKRRRPILVKPGPPKEPLTDSGFDPRQLVALGASTGGTQALEEVLQRLPASLPGIVVVQHIPAGFSASFAARLNRVCALEVREARHGDMVRPGLALLAPGDRHMEIQRRPDGYRISLHGGPAVEHQRPSVDVLFKSVARSAGRHAVAALLTGMGQDGAAGMKLLHDVEAYTIAQDAQSSVVYGMARKAVELKAVDSIVSLEKLAGKIVKALERQKDRKPLTTYA